MGPIFRKGLHHVKIFKGNIKAYNSMLEINVKQVNFVTCVESYENDVTHFIILFNILSVETCLVIL